MQFGKKSSIVISMTFKTNIYMTYMLSAEEWDRLIHDDVQYSQDIDDQHANYVEHVFMVENHARQIDEWQLIEYYDIEEDKVN